MAPVPTPVPAGPQPRERSSSTQISEILSECRIYTRASGIYSWGVANRSRIYTESLLIRVTRRDLELLDARRGSTDRSSYLRSLIRGAPALDKSEQAVAEPIPVVLQGESTTQMRCPHRYASICDECAKKVK